MTNTAPRKTIPVTPQVEQINLMLELSFRRGEDPTVRKQLAFLVEGMLHTARCYRGFSFTDGENGRTDETVRFYYPPNDAVRGIQATRERAAKIMEGNSKLDRLLAGIASQGPVAS